MSPWYVPVSATDSVADSCVRVSCRGATKFVTHFVSRVYRAPAEAQNQQWVSPGPSVAEPHSGHWPLL